MKKIVLSILVMLATLLMPMTAMAAKENAKLNNVDIHTSLNSSVLEQCDVELMETDGTGFKIGAGLKLFGGSTRSYRKKSYEIKSNFR